MSRPYIIPVWKTAPFIRLLIPFIAGIMLQWYVGFPFTAIIIAFICFTIAYLLFRLFPLALRFKWKTLQGSILIVLLLCVGAGLTWQKDIRHHTKWFGNYYHDSDYIVLRIDEPLTEKTKSWKAAGHVESIIENDSAIACEGNMLLYFSKDSLPPQLHYGDRIIIHKDPQRIKNSGNPGAFNYEQYAAFQQIFHNVFLKEKDWALLQNKDANFFKRFLFTAREHILSVLRKYANPGKDELGIAEALLIGYSNDLDKDLVQAYSNTGVVHIIAISGMHLALIYVMLVWIFTRVPLVKKSKVMQVILILGCLWLFSLLTGGAASVLRSAVMFSFITIGKNFVKQSSIYNSLAASAFALLCYNPYFLWDVGFQLSYLALIGIIVFQKPIRNLVYIKNKWLNKIWELASVSLAAQILTFPICIYYFHQFPLLFLLANILVVPLSSAILYVEIFLLALSWIPFVATWLGKTTSWLVWLMNKIIMRINKLSFAVWDMIPATLFSTILLYAIVIGLCGWLLNKSKRSFQFTLIALLIFVIQYAYYDWQQQAQQKLILYNVSQHPAIDIVSGNDYRFIGDSVLLEDGALQNFHLKPARIALQLTQRKDSLAGIFQQGQFYQFNNKRIVLIDKALRFEPVKQKIDVDMIIISKNPKLYIPQLAKVFNCRQYIFDGSNSLWKIAKWQKDCEVLNLHCYSVPDNGAFVFELH